MTLEQQEAAARAHNLSLASSICECDDAEDLLFHLLMKRHYDGLNGRQWDASNHLRHEREAARILAGYHEPQE